MFISLQAELDGFQVVVREGLQVSAAFAARVNLSMAIGSLNETVTVSGQIRLWTSHRRAAAARSTFRCFRPRCR